MFSACFWGSSFSCQNGTRPSQHMARRNAMMPRTAHMAIAANSGSPPIHSLHHRPAALRFCDSFFPHCGNTVDSHGNDPTNNSRNPGNSHRSRTHCGFSRDGCVMPSDGSPGSSAMIPPLEPSLRMIPWYPAIGPESENARGRKPRQPVRNTNGPFPGARAADRNPSDRESLHMPPCVRHMPRQASRMAPE